VLSSRTMKLVDQYFRTTTDVRNAARTLSATAEEINATAKDASAAFIMIAAVALVALALSTIAIVAIRRSA